ncbi:hypothetical protein [Methylophaga sp.]|uniref:hypothetical protein n=1 Tax=Methylophaga sp. TaxID=2024840 RepID=UPI0027229018|nr:hypothetical protein [Methylophaga sp.]MDO8826834.1 hypothetical protein [Methylophaga sp.]
MNEQFTEWEVYVGRLIVSFGDIELLTFKLFENWFTGVTTKNYSLEQRLNKLIDHVTRISDKDEKRDELKMLLIRSKQLKKFRNLVAHNPVVLKKYNESEYEDVVFDLRKKAEPISIEKLNELSDEARSLASELFIIVSQYTGRGIDQLIECKLDS